MLYLSISLSFRHYENDNENSWRLPNGLDGTKRFENETKRFRDETKRFEV